MRLTATDKAIGELNMRKADIERAQALLQEYGENAEKGIVSDLVDIDRCIKLLQSVAPAPKPEKPAKERKPRTRKKAAGE